MTQAQVTKPVFHWNGGGWFGAQLGATCWMLISAALLLPHSTAIAAAVLVVFLIANVVGAGLWTARTKIAAYPAIQILMAVCWASSVAAIFVIEAAGLWPALQGVDVGGGTCIVSAAAMHCVLWLMFPAIMVWFHVLHRRGVQHHAH